MEYIVNKNNRVIYNCPRCNILLENPLIEAGQDDKCPNCNNVLEVPGVQELIKFTKLQDEKAEKAEAELSAWLIKEKAKEKVAQEMKDNEEKDRLYQQRLREAYQKQLADQELFTRKYSHSNDKNNLYGMLLALNVIFNVVGWLIIIIGIIISFRIFTIAEDATFLLYIIASIIASIIYFALANFCCAIRDMAISSFEIRNINQETYNLLVKHLNNKDKEQDEENISI